MYYHALGFALLLVADGRDIKIEGGGLCIFTFSRPTVQTLSRQGQPQGGESRSHSSETAHNVAGFRGKSALFFLRLETPLGGTREN